MTKNGSNQNQNNSDKQNLPSNWIATKEEDCIIDLLNSPAGIEILNKLVKIDPFTLSKPRRLDYLAALEKQSGWLQAKLQQAIVAVAGDEPSEAESMYSGVDEFEREEVRGGADFEHHGVGAGAVDGTGRDQEVIVFTGGETVRVGVG
ncbi:MAG: hypothetical protein RLZZ378_67, partial [Actinomycetota bacterium]